MMKNWIYIFILFGALLFWFVRYRMAPSLSIEGVQLSGADGKNVLLSQIVADNTIVHFYASWCGPCMRELPLLSEYASNHASDGLKVIMITDDSFDKIERIQANLAPNITVYRVESMKDLGVYSIPTTYFLNQGKVVKDVTGECQWNDTAFHETIKTLLGN